MYRRLPAMMAFLGALALVIASIPLPVRVIAQEVITGPTTGISVTVSADWNHDAAASVSTATADSLVFVSGNANLVVTRGQVDLEEAMNLLRLDGAFTVVDATDAYSLQTTEANGVTYTLFSVVVGSDVHTVIAPDAAFASTVVSAQAGVQVDGNPVLAGVDGAARVPVSSSGEAAATAPPLLGSSPDGQEPAATATEGTPVAGTTAEATTASASVPEGSGFVDETTWVSPSFGTVVTWGDEWAPRITDTNPGFTSSASGNMDELCLYATDEALAETYGTAPYLCITVSVADEFDAPNHWQNLYGDPAVNSGYGIPYFAVNITDTGYVVAASAVDGSAAGLTQETLEDGTTLNVRFGGSTDTMPDLFDRAQTDVTINGEPPFVLIDAATFQAAYDGTMATLPELNAQRDAELQALGLVDPNHYQSVATGCDVAWDDTVRLRGSLHPVDTSGIWGGPNADRIPGEGFLLIDTQTGRAMGISCFASPDSFASYPAFTSSGSLVFEGANGQYAITGVAGGLSRNGQTLYSIYMVVTSEGGSTVMVALEWTTKAELVAFLETTGPGMLVIGGVDIFESMREDDIASQLP